MTDETKQRRNAMADITRADQAKDLINNPLYVEALTAMRAGLYAEFEDSKLDDSETRHELWQRMQILKLFQARFESILKHGEKGTNTLTLLDRAKNVIR